MKNVRRFNYAKLRGKIREVFQVEAVFADKLGVSRATLSSRLNQRTSFTIIEVRKICEILGLDISNATEYFFCEGVKQL
jgi:transcriptional regulator with XRE-family HTH domain